MAGVMASATRSPALPLAALCPRPAAIGWSLTSSSVIGWPAMEDHGLCQPIEGAEAVRGGGQSLVGGIFIISITLWMDHKAGITL